MTRNLLFRSIVSNQDVIPVTNVAALDVPDHVIP